MAERGRKVRLHAKTPRGTPMSHPNNGAWVNLTVPPAQVIPWLLSRLHAGQEPRLAGRVYYLMFGKGKKVKFSFSKKREVYVAVIPPELDQFSISTLEDVNRAIREVERFYESRSGGNPCVDSN